MNKRKKKENEITKEDEKGKETRKIHKEKKKQIKKW